MFGLKKKKEQPFVSAVIAAAGESTRMDGIDKQLAMLIDGMPVIAHSILQFQNCPGISEIIVVCRAADIAEYYRIVQDFGLDKVVSVVAGGKERQDSVSLGIEACSPNAAYYAIHDGARPLVTPELIGQCITDAIEHGAAALGVEVKDTVKTEKGGFIAATLERSSLRLIQTPQIFDAALYRRALAQAKSHGRVYTDDCRLVEQTGGKVFITRGSFDNIKITTPGDIIHANAILTYRGGIDIFGQAEAGGYL
ncbi:MAG: 2-C-methyl-D-erythritol 4-phosphate cytidylyltransferase [Oscillospiraceae bacterium]|nr:2-C-methyl-D-erythritol 4-phosphate cytidylyltransferase [Oscillospiraceae bacterium]